MCCASCVKGPREGKCLLGAHREGALGGEFRVELLGDVNVSSFVNGVVIPLECVSRKSLEVKLAAAEQTQQ